MQQHKYTTQELRFTAVLYAAREDVKNSLSLTGKLPEKMELGGLPLAAKVIEGRRGRDPILSEVETQIYEVILKERRLPAGGVILIPDCLPIYSIDRNQTF